MNFYLECEARKKLKTEEERIQRAKEIVQKYISSGAPESINLPYSIQKDIVDAVDLPEYGSSLTLFDAAEQQISETIINDSWRRFLASPNYINFLKDVEMEEYGKV